MGHTGDCLSEFFTWCPNGLKAKARGLEPKPPAGPMGEPSGLPLLVPAL
jgi:hypothetical protein